MKRTKLYSNGVLRAGRNRKHEENADIKNDDIEFKNKNNKYSDS